MNNFIVENRELLSNTLHILDAKAERRSLLKITITPLIFSLKIAPSDRSEGSKPDRFMSLKMKSQGAWPWLSVRYAWWLSIRKILWYQQLPSLRLRR